MIFKKYNFCSRRKKAISIEIINKGKYQGGVKMVFPKIISHRGTSRVAPENTMAAFREA
jgi:glycerophosphoryl diester phosphodiesterase